MLIVGEYLLNFHPGANHDIEDYLEKNGFEIIEARMTDVIRKLYYNKDTQIKEYHVHKPMGEKAWYATADAIFEASPGSTPSMSGPPACRSWSRPATPSSTTPLTPARAC